jgi:hypothetical protein
VEYELFVKFALEGLEADKVLVAVKVTREPEASGNTVILEQVKGAYLEKKVQPGIEIGRSSVISLICVVQEIEINLGGGVIILECRTVNPCFRHHHP